MTKRLTLPSNIYGGDEEAAASSFEHIFQVPQGAHWNDVRAVNVNIGTALQKALRAIERENSDTLSGIFGDAGWTNKERLSDETMRNLLDHFHRLPLSNENVESDTLGEAYEYLIKKLADLTNKKAGEFYTPRSVVRLMVNILDPREGDTILRTISKRRARRCSL